MTVTNFDWAIIFGFFALTIIVGIIVAKSASKSEKDFFLGGAKMPWWLLGFSMVATTFSTDTPNLVTNMIRAQGGVSANWSWWAFLLTGMLTVFIYAGLWRRSNAITDLEFYELRYSGKPAAFLRGFRALYLGIFFNVMVMGSVSVAAIKIGGIVLGYTPIQSILVALIVTVIFSSMGGFKGVIITDFMLFIMAMIGALAVAYYAVSGSDVGGLSGMVEKITSNPELKSKLDFFPDMSSSDAIWSVAVPVLLIPLLVQWWSVWYPGAEPGGGGYLVQRMLAAKDEKNAISATLFFNIAHYALRPWPWIIVGLASLIVFPMESKEVREGYTKEKIALVQQYDQMENKEKESDAGKTLSLQILNAEADAKGLRSLRDKFPDFDVKQLGHDAAYPAMLSKLPNKGWLGLVLASLIAAYMSTISTHLNWGSSYIVNDFYRRFIKPEASQRELVWVGRGSTVVLMVLTAFMALLLKNALEAFQILLQVGAGTGLLFILRWFWWRINAYSEIAAMVISFVVAIVFNVTPALKEMNSWKQLALGVAITTIGWVIVTFLTPSDDKKKLREFCRTINPGGLGWKKVFDEAEADGDDIKVEAQPQKITLGIVCMIFGCVGVYCALFSTGSFIYGKSSQGLILAAISAVTIFLMFYFWNMKTTKESISE